MVLELCDAVVIYEDDNEYSFVLEKYKVKVKKTEMTSGFVEKLIDDRFVDTANVQDEDIQRLVEKFKEKHILVPLLESFKNIDCNNLKYLSYVTDSPVDVQNELTKNIYVLLAWVE